MGTQCLCCWGSLSTSMFMLFTSRCGGLSCDAVVEPLDHVGLFWVVLFVIFISFARHAVLNVVMGVFCLSRSRTGYDGFAMAYMQTRPTGTAAGTGEASPATQALHNYTEQKHLTTAAGWKIPMRKTAKQPAKVEGNRVDSGASSTMIGTSPTWFRSSWTWQKTTGTRFCKSL